MEPRCPSTQQSPRFTTFTWGWTVSKQTAKLLLLLRPHRGWQVLGVAMPGTRSGPVAWLQCVDQ